MEAGVRSRFGFLVLLALAGCSKFGRLSDAEKVSRVTVGSGTPGGAHARTYAPQTGGVMVWAEKADGSDQAAFYLPSDTATHELILSFGTWNFYATGWDGTSTFSGNGRCGATTVAVDSTTSNVNIDVTLAGCAASTFFGTSALRPLKLITCNVVYGTMTGNTNCDGLPLGDLKSFKIVANLFDPSPDSASAPIYGEASSTCIVLSPPGYSTATTGYYIPEGPGSGSAMDFTIQGFTDSACGSSPVNFDFNSGFAAASLSDGTLFRDDGTSANANTNFVFLEHGPEAAPTVTAATSSRNSLNGGFPITISGTNFDALAGVHVGGVNCPITSLAPTSIVCTAPAAYDSQPVNVVVKNNDGQTASASFTYLEDGFGNGIDADSFGSSVTIASSIPDSSDASNSSMTSLLGGRTLQTFRNISGISGATVTLATPFTSSDYQAHDDVLWHVSGASSGANDCDTVSTTNLAIGTFGFARIVSVDTSGHTVTLDKTITANPSSNIGATTRGHGNTFCDIQLVRLTNFNNLTLDASSAALAIKPPAFNYASGYGGILAFRVAGTLQLAGGNAINLYASGLGRSGGAAGYQGDGAHGAGVAASSSSDDAGGGSAAGGAGGGGQGNGGTSSGASAGMSANSLYGSGFLDPHSGRAAFGGGGGGGGAGATGGGGGGIVMLFASTLSGSTSFSLVADGSAGTLAGSTSGGGGGGGTVFAQVRSQVSSPTIATSATGGSAPSATSMGGGGGGGAESYTYCSASAAGLSRALSGGNGYSTGNSGGSYGDYPNSSGAAFCP